MLLDLTDLQLLDKICSLVHFDYFSIESMVLRLIYLNFQIDRLNMKSLKTSVYSLLVKNTQKLQFYQTVSPLVHFHYSF